LALFQIILKNHHRKTGVFSVDLHVHTINSDARLNSSEVIRQAAQARIKIVITEHNFISDDYDMVRTEAGHLGIEIPFPGVEINTVYYNGDNIPERKYHVLAYGDCLLDKDFQTYIALPLQIKNDYYSELVDSLRRQGYELPSFIEILKGIKSDGSYRHPYKQQMNRSLIASYMSELTGRDNDEIKKEYSPSIPAEISYSSFLNTAEVVTRVREMGGVVGLAHPGWDRPMPGFVVDNKRMYDVIYDLRRKNGLHGVECLSRHHAPDLRGKLYDFCTSLGMIIIGGSDYHGRPNTTLGQYGLTEDELERVKLLLK